MRQTMFKIGGFLLLVFFLAGIFFAIVALKGPADKPQVVSKPPEPSPQPGKDGEPAVPKKITETRKVDLTFVSDVGSQKFSAVPLILVERTKEGGPSKIQADPKVLETLMAGLVDPVSPTSPKAADIEKDSRNQPHRIKRGGDSVVIDRQKTYESLVGILTKDPEKDTYTVPVVLQHVERENGFESVSRKLGFKVNLSQASTIHRDHLNDAERNENLRLAAEKIDGLVLQPGEEFNYDRVVGERSRKNGFRMAGVISNGRVVPGLGGGVCQVSTTLYNAALMSNMTIVERHNHSIYEGIPYAERGKDAAVSWGSKNFRFKNTLGIPVLISCKAGKGTVEAQILAEKKPFDRVEVVTKNEVAQKFPVQKQVKKAKGRPAETRIIRPGVVGYTIETYRKVTIASNTKEEKLHRDQYLMFPQIEEVWN